jgi:hypothetical protein
MAYAEATDDQMPATVATEIVDPTDPMEIIVSLSQQLQAWTDGETQLVVSMQTLTVLLEYIDFDTAFRYLHVLTHRIRAAGAVGYFQMDPDIHDPETINTIMTLFDVVVEVSDGNVEWIPTASGSLNTEITLTSETTYFPSPRESSLAVASSQHYEQCSLQYSTRMSRTTTMQTQNLALPPRPQRQLATLRTNSPLSETRLTRIC